MITRQQLIEKYLAFFKSKQHKIIPSASLVPENDPTVLFTTAGMHPLVPFLLGQKHPSGKRLVSVQKCVRTGDIEEVGDTTHHTFFEMLGNWSLNDYWKKEAISYSFEFLTKILKLSIEKLAVSCFAGDDDAPKDTESEKAWLVLGIPKERIAFLPKKNNWWGPAGQTGPCGPDTEMFYWSSSETPPKKFDHEDSRWVEIWNDVFMEYEKIRTKAILVDAINCLIDKKTGLNKELASFLKKTGNKIIVATNADPKEIKLQLKECNFEVFSLMKSPGKGHPDYFRRLLERHNLNPDEVIYFDHDKDNVRSAEILSIKSDLHQSNSRTKNFIENNSHRCVKARQKNVDTGMGVERTLAVINNIRDNYETDSFAPLIEVLEQMSNKEYQNHTKEMRIVADHLRAAVMMIAEGVVPSNVERGYVLRRLIRRAIVYSRKLNIDVGKPLTKTLAETVIDAYADYPELKEKRRFIENTLSAEEKKFEKTLAAGLKEFERISSNKQISGAEAFLLFQSHGFPLEMTIEFANEKKIKVDVIGFEEAYKKHQELSKTTSVGSFKSGLADNSEKTTRLHTATHLLNEALRHILGQEIKQRGSNITPERLRFDFNFPRKLTEQEITRIESLVNEKINAHLGVVREEVAFKDAISAGAQAEFSHKYPDKVSTYTIIDQSNKRKWFSKEICTGPHVKNTKEIGIFKIIKEESVAAGVRRIKAVVKSETRCTTTP